MAAAVSAPLKGGVLMEYIVIILIFTFLIISINKK